MDPFFRKKENNNKEVRTFEKLFKDKVANSDITEWRVRENSRVPSVSFSVEH